MHEMLQQGIDRYRQPRLDTDIDLVQEVRERLVMSGLLQRTVNYYDNNHFIISAKDKTPEVQRFLLNRYWSHQLMRATRPSLDERYCLIPNGEVSDWLSLFTDKILPFIIENNLPSE